MNNKKNNNLEEDIDDGLEVKEGRVIEALPAALFRVKFNDGSKDLICFLKGKIKVFKIKILVGDKVLVELDPYGGKGRIVRRM
jgi:translation initiation factor IF-1